MSGVEHSLAGAALIVGCGDIGLRVAQRLRAMGREVTGIVRSDQSAAGLQQAAIRARVADLDREHAPADADIPLVFYFAPPPASGDRDLRLRRWLAGLRRPPQRIVYISTSGVYGDCRGRWIDEDEPAKPLSDRARRRLDAEAALQAYAGASGCAVVVLRVPGIYGPGRLPVERLSQRLPVLRESESPWSNRIHAEDLAGAALAAAARGRAGRCYNATDGHPTTMTDYFLRCARALGLPEPPQLSLDEARRVLTPALWSFMEESRRIRNTRLREELCFTPRYPDLAAGLPSCLPLPRP